MRNTRRRCQYLTGTREILTVITTGLLCTTAMAAEQFYVGGGLGYSTGGSCEVTDATTNTVQPTNRCDTKSIEPKLYGGYLFNDYLGIELGYTGLNSTEFTLRSGGSAKFDASGLPVQAVVFLPHGSHLTWIGKLGFVRWSAKITSNFAPNESDSGFAIAAGIGAEYRLTSNLSIRGELEYFPAVGDENTVGEADCWRRSNFDQGRRLNFDQAAWPQQRCCGCG